VFGRVPRSLSRRLERAVFELRDEFEDLTQEQVLAALLHEHVDASDPAVLADLTETVRRYRRELGRR
jgi:DNA-binding phage protein